MEKKFLLFVLYEILIDIRERSVVSGDRISFRLSDLLHNVPLQLDAETDIERACQDFLIKASYYGMDEWIDVKKKAFNIRHPEYKLI